MAHIGFSNNPKDRTDKNSPEKVRAEITFYDENNQKIFGAIQGRWGQTDQPTHIRREETRKIESIDFPNHGAVRYVDLFMKYPEDDYCYGYNNESYDFANYQNPAFVIPLKRFFVVVKLFGAYLPDKEWTFEAETNGRGDTFKIRKIGDKWQKKENSVSTIKKTPLLKKP